MISRCQKCEGRKQIMGLGAMIVKCPVCKGIGHVQLADVVAATSETPVVVSIDKIDTPSNNKPVKLDRRFKANKHARA